MKSDKYQKMWDALHRDASLKIEEAFRERDKMAERLKETEKSADPAGAEIERAMLSYTVAEFNGILKATTWVYKRMREIEKEIERYED